MCRGHCGKVYHDRCKKALDSAYRGRYRDRGNNPSEWICWVCSEGKAECFICRKIDTVSWNTRKPIPGYVRKLLAKENPPKSEYPGQRDDPMGQPSENKQREHGPNSPDEPWKHPERRQKEGEPHLIEQKEDEQKETEFRFQFDNTTPAEENKVVKCYTGSCTRYYHIDCLMKSKHRCLFNSLKKDEFKCSLHFCKLCSRTSEESLLMQCLKCPTSFHLKCTRADPLITKLSRRHMICGTHYQEHVSDDSDRKEDAMENHSKYPSSDMPDPETNNQEDEGEASGDPNKSTVFKIEKHMSVDSKGKENPDEE